MPNEVFYVITAPSSDSLLKDLNLDQTRPNSGGLILLDRQLLDEANAGLRCEH